MLIFQRGKLGGMGGKKSHGCGEHWRTLENAQDEILHNSISPLGPNPEVCVENFLYIRQRKTMVGLQQNFPIRRPLLIKPLSHNVFRCQTLTHQNASASRGVEEEMRGVGKRGAKKEEELL